MSEIDVALVRPWARRYVPLGAIAQDPLGVGYLAATLRKAAYRVGVVDGLLFGFDETQMVETIVALRPKVVGISLHSFADYRPALAIVRGLKQQDMTLFCVCGGEHATFHARRILEQHPEVDAVVLGEGELTMLELTKQVLSGTCSAVVGAMTRQADGSIHDGGFRRSIQDLDLLPDADKDVVEMAVALGRPVALSVLTGRGCTNACKFCTAHTYFRLGGGAVWRRRSPERVADELERLVGTYLGRSYVHPMIQFQDVIFLGTSRRSRYWVTAFLDELDRRQLRFPFYFMARADALLANADIMPRLIKAGLHSVEIGIESGVERLLHLYSKRNTPEQSEAAIELLRRHGMAYDASGFIMFDPRMTVAELRRNAYTLWHFGPATWSFFASQLHLYPGTEVRAQMIADGFFSDDADIDDTSGYTFQHPVVDAVCQHTFLYDPILRRLDQLLRQAKELCARAVRDYRPVTTLQQMVEVVQDLYYQHFIRMIDLAELGHLEEAFPGILAEFLQRVWKTVNLLEQFFDSGATEPAPHELDAIRMALRQTPKLSVALG